MYTIRVFAKSKSNSQLHQIFCQAKFCQFALDTASQDPKTWKHFKKFQKEAHCRRNICKAKTLVLCQPPQLIEALVPCMIKQFNVNSQSYIVCQCNASNRIKLVGHQMVNIIKALDPVHCVHLMQKGRILQHIITKTGDHINLDMNASNSAIYI